MWAIDMMLRNDETQGHVVETNTKNHISRDMAIAALKAHVETHVIDGYEDAQTLISVLDTLPSIEPKKGCWIEIGREEGALGIQYKRLRCSNCGWESSLPIPRNFCPECGLDMKGETNGKPNS